MHDPLDGLLDRSDAIHLGSRPAAFRAGDGTPRLTCPTRALPPIARRRTGHPTEAADQLDPATLLEATAIALGASSLTTDRLATARAAGAALRRCRHDVAEAARLAHLFHDTLLAACPNAHMLQLIDRETAEGAHARRVTTVAVDELARIADDHDAILELIAAGAPARELERSLRQHATASSLCARVARLRTPRPN